MSILIKPAYDTDASAYFTTAGVTNTAGRQQISRFVTGIKDLGLWSSMVCWPLRSSQNAGTGTTAYSLGGLGTFNGTLVNGPTWGVDGVTSTVGSSQTINASNVPQPTNTFFFAVLNNSVIGWTSGVPMIAGANAAGKAGICYFGNGTLRVRLGGAPSTTVSVASSGACSLYAQLSNGSQAAGTNGVQVGGAGTSAFSPSGTMTYQMAGDLQSGLGTTTHAFSLMISGSVDPLAMHTLYKNTLGAGLGLP